MTAVTRRIEREWMQLIAIYELHGRNFREARDAGKVKEAAVEKRKAREVKSQLDALSVEYRRLIGLKGTFDPRSRRLKL